MSLKNNNIITIDGPSASGKGSLAKALAKELNFILLDSGLLYRAYSYCFDHSQKHSLAMDLFSQLNIQSIDHQMHVFENKKDITSILRHEDVAKFASELSSFKETRDNLISFQRDLASDHGLVADGRDMGTVVFKEAKLKIFLTASAEVRAKRRYLELQNRGQEVNMPALIADIKQRDDKDTSRDLSPLSPADDAHIIDSSKMSQEEVLKFVIKIVEEEYF